MAARVNELTVLYDADCGVCTHVARTLVRADTQRLLNLVALQSAQLPDMPPRAQLLDMLHVRDANGHWFTAGEASVQICRRIPLLRPLSAAAKLPLAMPVLDRMYRAFADNRHTISRIFGLKACKVPSRHAQ